MFSVTLFLMLWVHLSFFSREGNPEPQNQKDILNLMKVISEKEKISNWVIYSKVSIILKDLKEGNYILQNHKWCNALHFTYFRRALGVVAWSGMSWRMQNWVNMLEWITWKRMKHLRGLIQGNYLTKNKLFEIYWNVILLGVQGFCIYLITMMFF